MNFNMMSRGGVLVAAAVGVGLGSLATNAEAQSVAIAAAASADLNNPRYTDVQDKLMATGLFTNVDIVNVIHETPSLFALQQYDAVITWSNVNYFDNVALGNVLADYVDAGGGVVVAVFATSTTTANRYLAGRWITDGYEIIPSQSGNQGGAASLGTIHDPGHPIMQGVNSISGTTISRPVTTAMSSHGVKIAEWDDGRTVAGVSTQFPNRVDLGLYPPSADVTGSWWVGDGAELMANSLVYSIASPVCVGDLTGNGSVGVPDLLELLAAWGPCPSGPDPSGECAGFCDGQAPSGCWCDEFCDGAGDCCPDVCDGCWDLPFCDGEPIPPCPADLTGNGSVGVPDLLELLANWGPCPQVTGACCVGETCSAQPQDDCADMGGVYKGNNVACDPNPCLICGPLAGGCCMENPTPGCNDEDCCELICSQDPFCCDFEWDDQCASAANNQCDVCICVPLPGDAEYQHDNGTVNSAITWTAGGVVAWAQRYDRTQTGLVLTNVATTFGTVGGTSAVSPGDPVGIGVLEDTGAGPGASVWWSNSYTADAAAINTGALQKFDVPDVNLPESFYLIAWVQVPEPPNAHPAPGDTGSLAAECPEGISFFADDVWLMGAAGNMDFFSYDPDANVSGPLNMHGAGFEWVFLLRGNEP